MLTMRSHSLRLQHCASQHGCRMKTNPFLLDHQTLNKLTPLSAVDVFRRGCQQRIWIDVFFNCTPDNFKLDQWKLNCAKHKIPLPLLCSAIHPHPCSPLSHPTCPAVLTQNKALMFLTTAPFHSHWCNIAAMTKQSPPFCQVRSTNNSVAAISQTLQRGHCTQVNAEQRHTVITYFCRDVMLIITSNVRNKFWFCNNPSEEGLTFLSECIVSTRWESPVPLTVTWIPTWSWPDMCRWTRYQVTQQFTFMYSSHVSFITSSPQLPQRVSGAQW